MNTDCVRNILLPSATNSGHVITQMYVEFARDQQHHSQFVQPQPYCDLMKTSQCDVGSIMKSSKNGSLGPQPKSICFKPILSPVERKDTIDSTKQHNFTVAAPASSVWQRKQLRNNMVDIQICTEDDCGNTVDV